MLVNRIWREEVVEAVGHLPVLAFAVHDGRQLRDDVADLIALDPAQRRREEDPCTGEWTTVAATRVVALMSRFQVDLNRPRDRAVYRVPDDAWGLTVWSAPIADAAVAASLAEYDLFYDAMHALLSAFVDRFGRFVVLDLHSYNHRREGPDGPPADPIGSPQVNLGTGTMDREYWAPVVDRFVADLRAADFPGGPLDVRENVKFRGGNLSRWVHEQFPRTGCSLAVEFKKFYMDEWTGESDPVLVAAIASALRTTLPGLVDALGRL